MNPRDHLESKDLLFPSLVSIERVEKYKLFGRASLVKACIRRWSSESVYEDDTLNILGHKFARLCTAFKSGQRNTHPSSACINESTTSSLLDAFRIG